MFYRVLYISLLFIPLLHAQDPKKDAGAPIPGSKYVGNLPNGHGHTEIGNTSFDMPKGPELTPDFGQNNPSSSSGTSSGWGLLGIFANVFKKSARDIERENVRIAIDKALSKAQSGIPLTKADCDALGTTYIDPMASRSPSLLSAESYSPPVVAPPVLVQNNPAPVSQPVYTGTPTPFLVPDASAFTGEVAAPAPTLEGAFKPMKNLGSFKGALAGNQPSFMDPTLPKPPTFLPESPFAGPKGGSGNLTPPGGSSGGDGVKAVGTVVAGGALLTQGMASTAPAAVPATAGGTAGVGATAWAYTVAAAPVVGALAVGGALGIGLAMLHDGIFNPGIGWFPSAEERAAYHAKRAHDNARKANQSSYNIPSSSGSPSPQKPDEPKERKFNTIQKTEALAKIKENYRYDKQTNLYKLKDNGKAIKCTRTGKDVINVKWDGAHGDIECLDKRFKHMGSLDPKTFDMYKAPEFGRQEL